MCARVSMYTHEREGTKEREVRTGWTTLKINASKFNHPVPFLPPHDPNSLKAKESVSGQPHPQAATGAPCLKGGSGIIICIWRQTGSGIMALRNCLCLSPLRACGGKFAFVLYTCTGRLGGRPTPRDHVHGRQA